ncbi:hypothetical protein AK812_SmicGene24831 [Symbiodinium microadriaticum]|uniref:Uncharacterized protein n=1 Tax=Symbiodinium microadriaticum TaxID=2951 RepID=A0A1Q9DE06_SYMMI|nr:hypothetical protein AK812_SmicGene24831 [Symbiodinium microadriaticum]
MQPWSRQSTAQYPPLTFQRLEAYERPSKGSFLTAPSPGQQGQRGDGTGSAGLAPRFRDSMASGRMRNSTATEVEGDDFERNGTESEDRVGELTYSMDKQGTDLCTSMDSSNRSSWATWSPSRMRPKQSNATASMSLKSMELEDPSLLRATTLVHILAGWGKHLKTIGGGPPEYSNKIFSKSQPTEEIDYFVSHCWRDTRLPKLLALWIHSNIGGAICMSLLVGFALAMLVWQKVIPSTPAGLDGVGSRGLPWCLIFGSLTFAVSLVNWHHLRAACGFRRTYFMDKFCVHQGDPDLKRRGVASFAAFIGKSQRMLLLWSPQYFTRLWCTLEVAALVRASNGVNGQIEGALPLDFFPLQLASVSCMAWLLQFIAFLAIDIYRMFNPNDIAAASVTIFLVILASMILMRSLTATRFPVIRMTDPERVLKWFENLDTCNQHIREKVKDQVLAVLGPSQHYPTRMILPVMLINIFDEADYISSGLHVHQGANGWFSSMCWCCFVGTAVPVCYRISHYFFYKPCSSSWCECLMSLLAGVLDAQASYGNPMDRGGAWRVKGQDRQMMNASESTASRVALHLSVQHSRYAGGIPTWLSALAALALLFLLIWLQRADWIPLFYAMYDMVMYDFDNEVSL